MVARWNEQQTFTVASDERLIEMICTARYRLVVVAPGLTRPIADALARRCPDESISITVVLDADAEVYRLGYGDSASLELLRTAMTQNGLGLGFQPGVRIGMVVSDERMVIFSPVPQLVEAGSDVQMKPNAILLGGDAVERVVVAAGGSQDQAEIGEQGLGPDDIARLENELRSEPPQKFHIARAVRVFSSRAEFVELEIENLRVATRRVALPPELLGVRDEGLKGRISGGIHPPAEAAGPFDLEVEQEDGSARAAKVGQAWVNEQRAEIERRFTFVVPKHGRVILIREKEAFEAALARFQRNSARYREAVLKVLAASRKSFKETLLTEYMPRWLEQPPLRVTRFYPQAELGQVKECLEDLLDQVLDQGFSLDPMRYRVVYKGITWASANDDDFVASLTDAMQKRGVPRQEIKRLFSEFDAARAAEREELR